MLAIAKDSRSEFSVAADLGIARQTGIDYRTQIQKTLDVYFQQVELKLGARIDRTREVYSDLNPQRRFTPAVYAGFFALRDALKNNQRPAILDALQYLSNIRESPYHNGPFSVTSVLTEDWETNFILRMRELPIRADSEKCGTIFPMMDQDLTPARNQISEALNVLSSLSPEIFDEFNTHVTRVKLFNGNMIGLTSQETFGALFLKVPEANDHAVYYFLEHLVHEAAHLQLHALMAKDPLILNPPTEGYRAPIRKDPRPMKGIFHATFVLARLMHVFNRLARKGDNAEVTQFLERIEKWWDIGYGTIREHGHLTKAGTEMVASFEGFIRS